MPLEHLGLAVPDIGAAKEYYDELMPMLGYVPCFGNGYCPEDFRGTQIFLYTSETSSDFSRHEPGLQHMAFLVSSRKEVHQIHDWATSRGDEIVRAPKPFPQFGPDCYAAFFLDPHGFMIEVVSHTPEAPE